MSETEKTLEEIGAGTGATDPKPTPKKWWQWLLLYPALGISLLGAVPTYMEAARSFQLGVPFGRSFDATEQNKLWQENFQCTQKATFNTITNKHNVEIGAAVCESGDVLLRGRRPEWDRPQLRWVSWDELVVGSAKTEAAILNFFGTAYASERGNFIPTQARVMCQRWVGNGLLLQRVATPSGCFDQVVNTFSGWIVSNRPAPCNQAC